MTAAVDWNRMESDHPAPGEWTTEDLDALPDDGRRYELIDGVLTLSPSPTRNHQTIAMFLGVALTRICPPEYDVTQAIEVRINRQRSLVPDVLVTTADASATNPNKYLPHQVVLAIEIVSRSSRVMDRITKPALYAQAGIPFYWRIETKEPVSVLTYQLDPGTGVYQPTGTFTDVISLDEPWPISLPVASLTVRPGSAD